jgi:ribosomal-protein-alanine N-acetyltransferase
VVPAAPRLRPAPERLSTERMVGVRLDASFTDALVRMWEDERVTATLGGRRSPDQVAAMVRSYEGQWADNGFGEWAWHDRDTGAFVGRAGLRRVTIDGADEVELGYAFVAERWGQGLATEAAREILRVAFDEVGLPGVVSFTLPTNRGSRNVMEKCGFVYEKDVIHADLPHVFYRHASWVASET